MSTNYNGYMLIDVVGAYMASVRAPVGLVAPPPVAPPQPIPPPFSGPVIRPDSITDPLGAGIIRPFHRTEHQDFASDSGPRLVMACVGQVLGTPIGTLPWEPDFGSNLFRLRHRNQDPTFSDLCRIYSDEAIRKWEPRATVLKAELEPSTVPIGQRNAVVIIVHLRIGGKVFTTSVKL